MDTLDRFLNPHLAAAADEFDRRADEITRLKAALDAAEAERIALADHYRAALEHQGFKPTTAALRVQGVIDHAAEQHQEAIKNGR